jgi:two-component system sensor histidine kinase HydH
MPPHPELVGLLMSDNDSAVLLVDPDGRLAALNPAGAAMLAVAPARARGRSASDLLRTVVAGDDPVREALRHTTHEREAVLARGVPVLLRSRRFGRPPWLLLTLRDQTRARRLEQELRRHERLATLGQLSAGVAHEIRNPLAGIGTSAQVLLRRFEPRDERARFVQVILEEVERLDRIVTSLLQYARPRVPELRSGALAPCIERVIELTREPVAAQGITVEVDVAPRLGPVYIDLDLVRQVLLNVTLNAVQAMPSGGTLRYEVRAVRRRTLPRGPGRRAGDAGARQGRRAPRASAGRDQQVRVIDTGVGIPRHALGKLFDPFFSTRAGGTGLGLSIVQSIMQEHGGTIAVASREGRGTTVLLNFPMEKRHGPRRDADPD